MKKLLLLCWSMVRVGLIWKTFRSPGRSSRLHHTVLSRGFVWWAPSQENLFCSPKDQFLSLQVSALTSHCPVIISVEGHQMTVVATDGQEVEPEVACFHPFLTHFLSVFWGGDLLDNCQRGALRLSDFHRRKRGKILPDDFCRSWRFMDGLLWSCHPRLHPIWRCPCRPGGRARLCRWDYCFFNWPCTFCTILHILLILLHTFEHFSQPCAIIKILHILHL